MSAKRTITAVVIVAIAVALILAGIDVFVVNVRPRADGTYTEVTSSIHAPPFTTATNGQIALRVNNVSDASNPAMADLWAYLSEQASGRVYCRTLTPSVGDENLIANVTVTNVRHAPVPFTYADFFLVGSDGVTYYSNYAECGRNCSADALRNRTLNADFTSDLYVLFAVPTTAQASKLVYASDPQIVLALS